MRTTALEEDAHSGVLVLADSSDLVSGLTPGAGAGRLQPPPHQPSTPFRVTHGKQATLGLPPQTLCAQLGWVTTSEPAAGACNLSSQIHFGSLSPYGGTLRRDFAKENVDKHLFAPDSVTTMTDQRNFTRVS